MTNMRYFLETGLEIHGGIFLNPDDAHAYAAEHLPGQPYRIAARPLGSFSGKVEWFQPAGAPTAA